MHFAEPETTMSSTTASQQPARQITKVAVLGAGTMGSRIAAHCANAGIPAVLLDIVPPGTAPDASKVERNKFVLAAMEGLKKSKPAAFFSPDVAKLLTIGNFDDDMALIASCDWIIEVVAENLEIKRALLAKVLVHRKPGTITTTNTSGLPIAEIVEGLDEDLQAHWFGTHFFNPPRYMRLLEIIPTSKASPEDIEVVAHFCDQRLGKAIVRSFDQPNFIANRVGNFSMGNAIHLMQKQGLTIEDIDTLTGKPIGWPNSGTFRLGDMVGVDVMTNVAKNFTRQAARIHDERPDVQAAPFIDTMLANKWLGDKTKQGFYKKMGKGDDGRDLLHVLDWQTLDYRAANRPKYPAIEMAKAVEDTRVRIKQLLHADPATDKAAAFYWPYLTEVFTYAANRLSSDGSQPAENIVAIDQAMKTGYNWELGPFEMMDAAGVRETTEKMKAQGLPVSPNVEKLLAAGGETWYKDDASTSSGRVFFDPLTGVYKPVQIAEGITTLATIKKSRGVVKKNSSASLIDLGNGIAAIELHSKMNALGQDIVSFVTQTLKPGSDAVNNFSGFVITGDSANFSVGANLMQLVLAIQEEEWEEVGQSVKQFQGMTQSIKFCPRPVVVAPYGMTLGGGCEMSLHAAARQPYAELYMGLVEAGVGLIPGGGGCKELAIASVAAANSIRPDSRGEGVEIFAALQKNFELVAKATVSTSVADARAFGYIKPSDLTTMNRERLVTDAAVRALALAEAGYTAPAPVTIAAPGANALATLKLAVYTMHQAEFISDHDAKVSNWAAYCLTGGNVTPGTMISEEYLLDLEREAFLSLCGEKKTQERISHTLKTGKPLRN